MRISDLAETTGVPVHTLKYYLREGLLMPGEATSRTRAEYGPEHVERVRLVRALVEHGGIGIAGVRSMNHRSTTTWMQRVLSGQSPVAEREDIGDDVEHV